MAQELEHNQNKKFIIHCLTLLFIALTLCGIFLVLHKEVQQQKEAAYTINISGRQRMLSQFIAIAASEYKNSPSQANADILITAIADMRKAHDYLIELPMSANMHSLYYSPTDVDIRLKHYLSIAQQVMVPTNAAQASKELSNLRLDLLASLEKIVFTYQKEAQDKTIQQQNLQLLMLLLMFSVLVFEAIFIIFPSFKKLQKYSRLATQDTLTGCNNRRHFLQLLRNEHKRCMRYKDSYAVFIIDIDHFKKINDTYGHPAGDKVIQQVARTIEKGIRTSDQCGRIGGEEFGVLLVKAGKDEAYAVAEKLRVAIENMDITTEGHSIKLTVSVGIAIFIAAQTQEKTDVNVSDMIKRADMALYTAKQSGRNQTHLWER
jgi:diguanylate cyclase (GGDEF)-like protein